MKLLSLRVRRWLSVGKHSRDDRARDRREEVSIANIDRNATTLAASNQVAKDASAESQGSPAEQGGQG
jgi:hypothetical protein